MAADGTQTRHLHCHCKEAHTVTHRHTCPSLNNTSQTLVDNLITRSKLKDIGQIVLCVHSFPHSSSHCTSFASIAAKSHSHVEKTVLVLEVKPDIKDAECEEIVQTLKDTMVNKSGS